MLSIINPPDPSCSCKSLELKSDERASDKRALQRADLLKPGFGDDRLSKFSIRDYVFTARSEDSGTNWPFPQPYLHFCLKHGIKDLLPPFERPNCVRSRRCFKKALGSHQLVCVDGRKGIVEVGSLEKENVCDLDGESCQPFDQSIFGPSDKVSSLLQEQEKLTGGLTDTDLCRLSSGVDQAGGEGKIPSSVTDALCGRQSIPIDRLLCSSQEANTLSDASVELEVAAPLCASHKTGNTIELAGKKCKLILKLGIISDPSHTEDNAPNHTTISEPMASKICPVCKTFSSTSNTTLNAHIDRCLAVESTSKWIVNSKPSKLRVKPRKKRSMVDICAMAPCCTLEELDRRNGSNWAVDLSLSSAHAKVPAEGKGQRLSLVDLEDSGEDSTVYFDSNGTKLRILSKFKDASVSMVGQHSRPRKYMKDIKSNNNISIGERRRLAPKHSKYLKLKPQTEEAHCLKLDMAKIHGTSEGKYGMEENPEKEESLSPLLKVHDHIRPSESGALVHWKCSKRTSLSKKFCSQDGDPGPECSSLVTMEPFIDSNQSNSRNSSMARSHILKFSNSSEDPISSLKRKRVGTSLHGTRINGEKSSKQPLGDLNRLSKGSTSSTFDGCVLKLSKSSGSHASSPRSRRVEIRADTVKNSNSFPKATPIPSMSCHHFSAKGKKTSSFCRSKFNETEKVSSLKKSWMHRSIAETVDQVDIFLSDVDEQYDQVHDYTENQTDSLYQIKETHKLDCSNNVMDSETENITDEVFIGKRNALESGQESVVVSASKRGEPIGLESLQSGPNCCGLIPVQTIDSHLEISHFQRTDNAVDEFDGQESPVGGAHIFEKDAIIDIFPEKAVGNPIKISSINLASEFHKLGNRCDVQCNSLQSIEEHKRSVCGNDAQMGPNKPSCSDDQETGCAYEIGSCIVGQNTHIGEEMANPVRGENSHSEVDIIPNPGSPESFLLSPGDLKVPQENSSPTSSRVLSFQDQYVLVDGDSLGSPVSSTSTISHPHVERSDLKYSELESSPAVKDKLMSSLSCCTTEPVVADATKFPCAVSVGGAERTNLDKENVKVTMISGPLKFSVDQSCCYSRREGISWDVAPTCQESQLLKQHAMTPAMHPAKENQMTGNPNIKPEMFDSFSTCPSLRIDEMMDPVLELPTGHISIKSSLDAAINFPSHGDSDSCSPSSQAHHPQSTSNPVLRLMGKNLMVVNKDEDRFMQLRQIPTGAPNDCPNAKYLALLGFSNGDVPNQGGKSLSCIAPGGSIFSQVPCNPSPQCSYVGFSNGFRNCSNSKAHQTLPLSAAENCQNMHVGGFATSFLQHHGLKGRMNLQTQQKRQNSKPNYPVSYHHNAISAAQAVASAIQEMIIIDDSPENDADSRLNYAKYTEGSRGRQQSPVAILTSAAPNSSLRQLNSFPSCHLQSAFAQGPPVGLKSSFLGLCPGGAIASPVNRGGTSEGSTSVLLQSPYIVPHPPGVI